MRVLVASLLFGLAAGCTMGSESAGDRTSTTKLGTSSTTTSATTTTTTSLGTESQPVIQVFLLCGDSVGAPRDWVCPSPRRTSGSPGVLQDALRQLFAGPTASEGEAGRGSIFSSDTAELQRGVNLSDGIATVDLHGDVFGRLGGVGTTYGSGVFLVQLEATIFQFPVVQEIVFMVDGDPLRFCRSLEASEDCNPWTRAQWERL